jgi:hypothetical protein
VVDIILLDQFLFAVIGMLNVFQKRQVTSIATFFLPVILQPFRRDPLQRRPAVWRIPLLAAVDGGGRNPARFQQAMSCRGDFIGTILRRRLHVKGTGPPP